jgi:aryl-alcohol dehydrogenase-like predicted oxidoreductase
MSRHDLTRREFAGAAVAATALQGVARAQNAPDPRKTRSYNPDMEYRRLGRTNLMVSVLSMGGHWKRIPFKPGTEEFKKNRREVIYAALDRGVNYIDACSSGEATVYAEALGSRRKEIYFGFDWTLGRDPAIANSFERMKQGIDDGLRKTGLDYVDLWRVTMREQTTMNTVHEIETVMAALEWGKKTGKARFTGISAHHRPWIAEAVALYPQLEVVVTPYAAGSKEKPVGSMFESFRKHDVGFIGIKPFASGTLFASGGTPDSETKREDDERARMALRYVAGCEQLAASIPGLMTVDQVNNAAAAIRERRQFDMAEAARYQELVAASWHNLPPHYHWLRDWEWV